MTASDKEVDKDVFSRLIEGAKANVKSNEMTEGFTSSGGTKALVEEERRTWKERQEEVRREHQQNPILYYCDKIRGTIPDYEKSFEEKKKDEAANIEARRASLKQYQARRRAATTIPAKIAKEMEMTELERRVYELEKCDPDYGWYEKIQARQKPPEGMTKTQWEKEKRRVRRELREEEKQRESDWHFKCNNSPQRMFINMVEKVDCRCEAEEMRAGKFCDTCILISKVKQYMLDLFKDGAEGRSSYI